MWLLVVIAGCGRFDFAEHDARVPDAIDAPFAPCTAAHDVELTTGAAASYRAALASTGTNLGVAWEDTRDGNDEIYFAVLDLNGARLTSERRITSTPAISSWPSLAWSGSTFGVMWDEAGQTMFEALSGDGTPLGAAVPLWLETSGFVPARSQIWIGAHYTVAWQARSTNSIADDIFVAELDAAGAQLVGVTAVTSSPSTSAFSSIAYNGTDYGVVWNDDRDGQDEIYFATLDAAGTNTSGDVRVTNAAGMSFFPTIAWTGSTYGVSWWDNRSGTSVQYFALLDRGGARLGDEIEVTPNMYSQAGIVRWSGREFGVEWYDFRNGILEPYFARLDRNGTKVGDDLRLSSGGIDVDLETGDIVWTGDRFAIVFGDKRTGNSQLYLTTVSCP